jgi:uncharacterized protein YndB with AHSA1/START domain
MSTTRRRIDAPVEDVFAALTDPHTYPHWLIGAQDIRDVDDGWPAPGTRFHHRVGLGGPLTVDDSTKVLAIDAPHRLDLEVRARPLGRGRASFRLGRDGQGTQVVLEEHPLGALSRLEPLLAVPTRLRNGRSLGALAELVENRRAEAG